MNAKLGTTFMSLALLLIAVPVWAHHAFSAEYDASKPLTLKRKTFVAAIRTQGQVRTSAAAGSAAPDRRSSPTVSGLTKPELPIMPNECV